MKQRAAIFSLGLLLAGAAMLPAHGQIFGQSDAEKQHEADQDSQLNALASRNEQLQGRVQVLEDKVRSLTDTLTQATGSNEDLRHQLDLLSQKLDQQQKDFAYRLCMLSAQQLGAGEGDQGLNCAATGAGQSGGMAGAMNGGPGTMQPGAPLPPIGNNAGASQTAMAPPPAAPNSLGALSSDDAGAIALRPAGGNQYDAAMNLLAKAQYDEAKASFRAYADANPDDDELSPQAIYWVGNIDFIQHDYQGAIAAFAEQIKKFPKSPRGPDSMLKLGQSLLAMGRTDEGCTTLGAIKSKFPGAPAATLTIATGARKTACR